MLLQKKYSRMPILTNLSAPEGNMDDPAITGLSPGTWKMTRNSFTSGWK